MFRSRRRLFIKFVAVGLVLALVLMYLFPPRGLKPDQVMVVKGAPELSGLAWHPGRETLFGVSDEHYMAEIDAEGKVLRRRDYPGRDLEDLCLLPGEVEFFVVEERGSALLTVRAEDLEILASRPLPPISRAVSLNKRYEGMAYDANRGRLFLLNEQQPAVLVEMELEPEPRVLREVDLDCSEANAVLLPPGGEELVILSKTHGLRLYARDGTPRSPWRALAVGRAEGAAIIPGRGLYVASDDVPSRIAVFRGLDSWDKLRTWLVGGP